MHTLALSTLLVAGTALLPCIGLASSGQDLNDIRGPRPAAEAAAGAPDATPVGPRLVTDFLVIGGITGLHSIAYHDVRRPLFQEGSIHEVFLNFRHPIRRAVEGGREDDDGFRTNYVAHPVSWGLLGLYLKERGYSNLHALLFSQVHSIAWEYAIEGFYQKPSSVDLVTNAVSSTVAIFALHDLSERASAREGKGLHHRILAALNPLRPLRSRLAPGEGPAVIGPLPVAVDLQPSVTPGRVGLQLSVRSR